MEAFDRLNAVASSHDLSDLYMGASPVEEVQQILQDMTKAVDTLLDPINNAIDLTLSNTSTFLHSSLPILIELLLRRKSRREHEKAIAAIIVNVAKLLAQPASHDIAELCELRNMVLLGGTHSFQFLSSKQLASVPAAMVSSYSTYSGFYGAYGRPAHALVAGKVVTFWPSEWRTVLGEQRAVGHFVQYHCEDGQWVEGNIIAYDRASNLYRIQVKKLLNLEKDSSVEQVDDLQLSADLQRPHLWVDLQNQQRMGGNSARLKFSSVDVGKFIRVWWSRYQRFYYGRVSAFDASSKQHTIVYEDADSRSYDMSSKEYELIDAPLDVLRAAGGLSDAAASKIIADWHGTQQPLQEKETDHHTVEPEGKLFAPRPTASSVANLSSYQLDAVNEYFAANGGENMFQSMADSIPAPSCRVMLLHLQLVYQLRQHIGAKRFRDLTWDLKELTPLTLLRYDEAQIKEFNLKEFNELLFALRDLLHTASVDLKEAKKPDMQESFDLIRLTMAHKLLSSTKIQKRYLGLSIVKDMIDSIMPKLGPYLLRRQHMLKKGTTPPPRPPHSYPSSVLNKLSLSTAKFDKWLEQSNIIDLLFGDSLHQDMIAKADSILVYMATRRLLLEQHIALIWQAAKGAHEAIVRVAYHVLLVLIPTMETSLRQYMFSLLSALSVRDYSEQILRLIQSFTIESLRISKTDNNKADEQFLFVDTPSEERPVVIPPSNSNRKGQVVNAPERKWMGFGLLWQFVQDSSEDSNIDSSLAALAVQLLVELLQDEFVDERETVMQRCIDNVQMGVSVPTSLQLLRKTLSLYPSANKSWFVLSRQGTNKGTTMSQQIEKLVKQSRLMEIVFGELERCHVQAGKSSLDSADGRKAKAKQSEVSKLNGVVERLDFLQFILSKSFIKLTEAQALIIWQVFGEDTSSEEALDKLCMWLDGLVTEEHQHLGSIVASFVLENDPLRPDLASRLSFLGNPESKPNARPQGSEVFTVLEENVVNRIFEDCILRLAYLPDAIRTLSRPAVASLCVKMFFLVNINNKSIRVENDGSWCRSASLTGLPLLWRLALDADADDISLAAMKVLLELHHRNIKIIKNGETVKAGFFRLCFKHLYHSMQSLHAGEGEDVAVHSDASQPNASDIKPKVSSEGVKTDEWFEESTRVLPAHVLSCRISRLVCLLRMFVHRFYYTPNHCMSIKVIVGADESSGVKFICNSSDTVGQLRKRIGQHFKEDPAVIIMQTSTSSVAADKLEKDDQTLQATKLGLFENIFVKKKDVSGNSNDNPLAVTDIITPQDIDKSLLDVLDPLQWLRISGSSQEDAGSLFALPTFPLQSTVLAVIEQQTGPEKLTEGMDLVSEQVVPIVQNNPHYIDQLLEMLDGFLSTNASDPSDPSDISATVWDILMSLPFQPSIYNQMKTVLTDGDSAKLRALLDENCPYRLLYSLHIIDSLLSPSQTYNRIQLLSIAPQRTPVEWAAKFFHMGGAESIIQLLETMVAKAATPMSSLCQQTRHQNVVQRGDLHLLISAMLSRIVQYLLAVDPLYRVWQCAAVIQSKTVGSVSTCEAVDAMKADKVPPGVIMSCVDACRLVPRLINTGCELLRASVVSEWVLQTFIEHSLGLVFGLCTARDDGLQIIDQARPVELLFRASFESDRGDRIQEAVARRCFEGCGTIYVKCADPLLSQEKKPSRMQLFDRLIEGIISTATNVNGTEYWQEQARDKLESIFSLLAAVECVKIAPERAFRGLMLFRDARMSTCARIADMFKDFPSDQTTSAPEAATAVLAAEQCRSIAHAFASRLVNHSSSETFHFGSSDGTLVGILRVLLVFSLDDDDKAYLGSLVGLEDPQSDCPSCDSFMEFVFANCLHPPNVRSTNARSPNAGLCQTAESRSLAYALLYSLSERCESNFTLLTAAILKIHCLPSLMPQAMEVTDNSRSVKKSVWQWDYDPNTLLRPRGDFIGLCNQGGTCYMNSFVQQLFHARTFTEGLLGISQYSDQPEYDNVLFQLQVMFGYLKLSQKRYYDTLPFCRSLIDYDGQPLSLSEQKDINEFAGMLFDKLEKNKACADLLARTVQGTLVWQTKSLETPYRSDREEGFFMISAEVKDKRSLLESLELNVAEELFTGDNKIEDSDSGRKVDAVRRCAIRTLPSTLIIHLKRFEFDLETMNRKKVNDFISFPLDLDMFPYTEEGIAAKENSDLHLEQDGSGSPTASKAKRRPDGYYQYVLKGVVAHVGAIDRGHYYSFIKDRSSGQWFEFNDRIVVPFNPDNIPKECFGGSDEVVNAAGNTVNRVRENNAYLLVYERKEVRETKETLPSHISPVPSAVNLQSLVVPSASEGVASIPEPSSPSRSNRMTKRVEEAVWTENTEFQADRFLFDATHARFYWKMLQQCEGPSAAFWMLITVRFVVDVLGRGRAHSCLPQLFDRFEEMILGDTSGGMASALLSEIGSHPNVHPWLATVFQDCPHSHTVRAFARIVTLSFKMARSVYCTPPPCIIRIPAVGGSMETDSILRQTQGSLAALQSSSLFPAARVLQALLVTAESLQVEDVARKDGFKLVCSLLHSVAGMGYEERYVLLRLCAVQRLVSLLQSMGPITGHMQEAQLVPCVELVAGLIIASAMPANSPTEEAALLGNQQITLFPEDLQAFLNRVFLEESIVLNPTDMSLALQHLCRLLPSKDTCRIVDFLYEKIADHTGGTTGTNVAYRAFFRALSEVLLDTADISVFQSVLNKMTSKSQYLTQRNGMNDAEFVYAVSKLLHRLGTSSAEGNTVVMRVKEAWKDTAARFASLRSSGTGRRMQQTAAQSNGAQVQPSSAVDRLASILG